MMFFLAFGPSYRFPRSIQDQYLGYGYNVNTKKFCENLAKANPCINSLNLKECESQVFDLPECMKHLDL
jgi:hypothetical protein